MATLVAVATVMVVTLLIGLHGVAAMRTTSDFLVASRRVSPLLNSAAVSGEYLSAASFLGVAGLVVRDGVGALWYPVGFTAGYIAMLILVAAPMRRSGALTVPDFAEARLASPGLRRLSAVVVLVIGALYLVPQLRTAGLVLSVVSDLPYWVGVVIAGVVVSATLALGGMRAATYVQAFQFLVKLLLFIVPALWLLVIVGPHVRHEAVHPVEFTHFPKDTAVEFQVDATLTFPEPVTVRTPDGTETVLGPGEVRVDANQTLVFPKDTPVPTVNGGGIPGGEQWHRPLLNLSDYGHPLLATLAVLTATALGTMGLPHVLMRFHTSPDGRSARRTAAFTVALLGIFYLFPGIYGALGRVLVPELYLSGVTDTVVVALPSRVSDDWVGTLMTTLLSVGAFAAFLATSVGLLLVISGAISYDLLPGGLRRLRITVLLAAAVMVLLALPAAPLAAGMLVTWGFTVAASTFCPLLVLGIWWPRLTKAGAVSGVLVGLFSTLGAIAVALFGPPLAGWQAILITQPAPWTVPLAFATMVVVSLRGQAPPWSRTAMLRLHLDEPPRDTPLGR
ncbi:putative transmembrane transport protein [Thermobifida fusca YX]|mgnify:FL=1|jgi:cation/acetate symporter|uniref:Transmembrane transport protein n=2 Tax=Thermobifida fusca TaxID=2021 RepID=A0A9P2WP39_THEFU|nr:MULTISPECIES: cation acetate symporter [Thermobifida]AAZ56893.1 putative transmembrane transport protein [Thermobifida fusca YX]EOR70005.1 transmembrane transport protein [Thermobifida fusca TM51]MBO2529950.1 cation acetate symporter [Thermobifida sp.]PPS94537.1 transporter [Thermobifida fusca]PZN62071.1 MAG: cation acetate symporter [Thermobifida fusca]